MLTLSLPLNSVSKVKLDVKNPAAFLTHIMAVVGVPFLIILTVHFLLDGNSFIAFPPSVSAAFLITISLSALAGFYSYFLVLSKTPRFARAYLMESLIAIGLILILYIYGEQDRFLINDNPGEDLIDFGFILVMVIVCWAIISFIFEFFRTNLSHLKKPTYLTSRGIALLTLIIPLDIISNVLYLRMAYNLPLYEDYWVLEIPLKISLILLINFLDEVQLFASKAEETKSTMKFKIGNQYRFIEPNSIAYFMVQNQISYLHTVDGEKLMVDLPLSLLEKDLSNHDFFRAGRQLLVSRKAITGYKSMQGKKIELSFASQKGLPEKYQISRLTAPDFRRWINN